MAFEVTESWTTSRRSAVALCLKAISSSSGSNWLEHPQLQSARRPAFIAGSVAVHAGFLYLLVQHGLVPMDDIKRFGASLDEARMVLLELTPPPAPAPLPDRQEEGSGSGDAATAPNVAPVFQEPPVMPSEWSIAKIRVARSTGASYNEVATTAGVNGSIGTGRGLGNGAGFDPYAGASPRRRSSPVNVGKSVV